MQKKGNGKETCVSWQGSSPRALLCRYPYYGSFVKCGGPRRWTGIGSSEGTLPWEPASICLSCPMGNTWIGTSTSAWYLYSRPMNKTALINASELGYSFESAIYHHLLVLCLECSLATYRSFPEEWKIE